MDHHPTLSREGSNLAPKALSTRSSTSSASQLIVPRQGSYSNTYARRRQIHEASRHRYDRKLEEKHHAHQVATPGTLSHYTHQSSSLLETEDQERTDAWLQSVHLQEEADEAPISPPVRFVKEHSIGTMLPAASEEQAAPAQLFQDIDSWESERPQPPRRSSGQATTSPIAPPRRQKSDLSEGDVPLQRRISFQSPVEQAVPPSALHVEEEEPYQMNASLEWGAFAPSIHDIVYDRKKSSHSRYSASSHRRDDIVEKSEEPLLMPSPARRSAASSRRQESAEEEIYLPRSTTSSAAKRTARTLFPPISAHARNLVGTPDSVESTTSKARLNALSQGKSSFRTTAASFGKKTNSFMDRFAAKISTTSADTPTGMSTEGGFRSSQPSPVKEYGHKKEYTGDYKPYNFASYQRELAKAREMSKFGGLGKEEKAGPEWEEQIARKQKQKEYAEKLRLKAKKELPQNKEKASELAADAEPATFRIKSAATEKKVAKTRQDGLLKRERMKAYAANVPKPRPMDDYMQSLQGSTQRLDGASSSGGSRKASLIEDLALLQSQHERDMADVHAIKRQLDLM